jgi:hypothetical protein
VVVNPAVFKEGIMSLPWEICSTEAEGMCECPSNVATEVSKSHSSEESSVMEEERRAESLEQVSFL